MTDNLLAILFFWNLIVFFAYGLDKANAIRDKIRISEKTLLFMAFLMGGLGAFFGMQVFRHKTKHTNFKIMVPLAVICNVVVLFSTFDII